MTRQSEPDAKQVFNHPGKRPAEKTAPEVPERIKNSAPRPQFRPDGSMRQAADDVDRKVREKQDAAKAERGFWGERTAKNAERLGRTFNRRGLP